MRVRHLRTNEEFEINFNQWETDYVNRKKDLDYEILIQDTVFLRKKNQDGTRTFFKELERNDALELINKQPSEYDYLEQSVKINGITFITKEFIGVSFEEFQQLIRNSLSGKELDQAFFHVTGKLPPSGHENINRLISTPRKRSPKLFKLSIGPGEINDLIYLDLLDERLVTVHKSTKGIARSGKTQFEEFTEAENGDYFYLCRGNHEIILFGQFTDNLFFTLKNELKDWGLRKYRIIEKARENNGYGGEKKWWTPNYNSTFVEIPKAEYQLFNKLIFSVFFESDFNSLFDSDLNEKTVIEETNKRIISSIHGSSYNISEKVNGVIGVKKQAVELAELLINLNSEKGMMVGLFGRWGRGKTFFWNEIKSYLKTSETKPFIFAEFHAWKYQDTPASWAYLYESIANACTEQSEYLKLFGIKIVRKNILKLNIEKYGLFKLVFALFVSICSVIWFFTIKFDTKIVWSQKVFQLILSGTISISTFIPAIVFYTRHIPRAIDLFKKYSKVVSFKNLLGLQSEIQNELIEVLKASIPNPESQRLLLFVDDLDRCSEDRIIQIIDSLKVMLEDSEISPRVIVLTAIDERILKRAIAHKYYDSITKSFDKNSEKNLIMNTLIREYMDKLFISGIKLTTLNIQEKEEIFDAFSKNQNKVHFKETYNTEDNTSNIKELSQISNDPKSPFLPVLPELPEDLTSEDLITEGIIEFEHGNPDYEIEEFEYDYLKLMLKHHIDATPRSIRIYYYRYLLAKRFLIHQLPIGSGLNYIWRISNEKKILPELIIFYSTVKNLDDLNTELKQIELSIENKIELELFEKYTINRLLTIQLMKVVEIVVAY